MSIYLNLSILRYISFFISINMYNFNYSYLSIDLCIYLALYLGLYLSSPLPFHCSQTLSKFLHICFPPLYRLNVNDRYHHEKNKRRKQNRETIHSRPGYDGSLPAGWGLSLRGAPSNSPLFHPPLSPSPTTTGSSLYKHTHAHTLICPSVRLFQSSVELWRVSSCVCVLAYIIALLQNYGYCCCYF